MVSKYTLLFLAGLVWMVAGFNVLAIGIQTWNTTDMPLYYKVGFTLLTFCVFFFAIFHPLYKKYTSRILSFTQKRHLLSFFDKRGWLIMAFMISLGISVRKFNLAPNTFITPFYTGLSIALSLTGFYFIKKWYSCIK